MTEHLNHSSHYFAENWANFKKIYKNTVNSFELSHLWKINICKDFT